MTAYPALRRIVPEGATVTRLAAADGWPLRVLDWPAKATRGSILWLGGRGDIFEKYHETFAHWHANGWHVTSFDWRGQGGSGRLLADVAVGHATGFEAWLDDLTAFWRDWVKRTSAPHVLMGHSMGGHLVLRALVEARVQPTGVVLSAPMLGFDTDPLPFRAAAAITRMLARLVPQLQAWRTNERPGPLAVKREHYLTRDADRYADELWWKEHDPTLALGPPSWAWLGAAYASVAAMDAPGLLERVTVPTLIVGTDGDKLVSPAAIRRAAARLPHAQLLMFGPEVAHELLRELDDVREVALARIDGFLDAL